MWTDIERSRQRIYPAAAHQPDGDIAEDQVVTAVGSYSASAPLISAGPWLMHMVAFRAASSPSTHAYTDACSYTYANPGSPHLCPRQLCDAAVAPDDSDGALQCGSDAGDLNVVIVGWNDATTQVSSLTDSNGNVYHLAVGPTVLTGPRSRSPKRFITPRTFRRPPPAPTLSP